VLADVYVELIVPSVFDEPCPLAFQFQVTKFLALWFKEPSPKVKPSLSKLFIKVASVPSASALFEFNSFVTPLTESVKTCSVAPLLPLIQVKSGEKSNEDIDFIRIALYPEHINEVIKYSNKLIGYGYKLYLNLIAVTSYETGEIIKLLSRLNESIDFSGLSIVDTYGALTEEKLLNIMPIFEEIVDNKKEIGLHLHENLNRSSLLYNLFIKNTSKDNLIIDCSLGGMGRVPGNFPTEVCANLMNSDFNKDYLIDELAQTASAEIQLFQEVNKWGYLPIYATSAILNIDRSYPEYFEKKGLSDKKNINAQEIIANNLSARKFSENIANSAISILNDKKRHIWFWWYYCRYQQTKNQYFN